MKHEVNWNKNIIDYFIKYGNLNDEQIKIMQLRTSNHSDIEIADKLHFSVATYYRRIKELKKIYDDVQNKFTELNLPKRQLLNEKAFDIYTKENAIEFINNLDWKNEKIEIKIAKK